MKKLLMALTALLLVNAVVSAQDAKEKKSEPAVHKSETHKQMLSECCMMKHGKMVHYKNGMETVITKETDMEGMKVMPDGTCKMKDGKYIKLKEGECCDTKGMVHKDCQKLLKKS